MPIKRDKNSDRVLLLWKSEGYIHIFLSTYREDITATLSRNKTLIPVISYNIKILLGPLTGLLNWSLRFRRTFWSLDTRVLGPNVLYENGHRRAVNKKPPLLLSEGDSRGRLSKLWLTTTLYLPRLPCPPGWMPYTASAGPQEQESCCLIIIFKGAFKSFLLWCNKMGLNDSTLNHFHKGFSNPDPRKHPCCPVHSAPWHWFCTGTGL